MMKKVNQTPSYGFYSRVLNKPFDTLEELQAAEEKVLKEQEAKTKAAAERKGYPTRDGFGGRSSWLQKLHNAGIVGCSASGLCADIRG
jgi:DNA-binding NtrC family response regulator